MQLTALEYSRMARRAADMLKELTEIHIAVDESGDADPHQERWGELTAELTQLHREVLESGYPSADTVAQLEESWLPHLRKSIAHAEQAINEHIRVQSGIANCHQEAKAILDHLSKARDPSD